MNLNPVETYEDQRLVSVTDDRLAAAMRFFDALHQQGIRYCHWKSNSRLDWGLTGRTDLDLLIDSEDKTRFEKILADHGIKPLLAPAAKQYPGLAHYLGFDAQTGQLFHLHVHFALVLGEQFVKNYSLPLEKVFLDHLRFLHGVKVPIVELELFVLLLRALLKYRDRDVVKDVAGIRSPGIPEHILHEIFWLSEQTTFEKFEAVLRSLPIAVDAALFLDLLKTLQTSARDGKKLFVFRSKVRKFLRPYQRHHRLVASLRYFQQLAYKRFVQRGKKDRQLSLPGDGMMVALIGVDGSGKSTLSSALTQWLSWKVDTPFYYLGSKQPSVWTKWSYLFFRMARRSHREFSAKFGRKNFFAKGLVNLRQIFIALHYLFVGYDRVGRYRLAKRKAGQGSVVIFDRFPFEAPLDGPEIHLIDHGFLNPVSRLLAHMEQSLYQEFASLDLLVLLSVRPEISHQRKPDHPIEVLRSKHSALQSVQLSLSKKDVQWDWVAIDAGKPFDDVFLRVKHLVWTAL